MKRAIKASFQDAPPRVGFSEMAGLLTYGSMRGHPSQPKGPVDIWRCSPLTVAGAVTDLALWLVRTVFPFHFFANAKKTIGRDAV